MLSERAKVIGQIIAVIKQLRKEADTLFSDAVILEKTDILIEEYFQQRFIPFLETVRTQVRLLPLDDYLPIELDAWIKLIELKLKAFEQGTHKEKFAEVLYIKQRFYPELIQVLKELQLEVLEAEFDARVDGEQSFKPNLGPNTIVISHESVALLIAMLYNFNLISGTTSIDKICQSFAEMTGYKVNDIRRILKFDESSGRLTTVVRAADMDVLLKLLRSMVARIESFRQYSD